jgi:hypothetical protein
LRNATVVNLVFEGTADLLVNPDVGDFTLWSDVALATGEITSSVNATATFATR